MDGNPFVCHILYKMSIKNIESQNTLSLFANSLTCDEFVANTYNISNLNVGSLSCQNFESQNAETNNLILTDLNGIIHNQGIYEESIQFIGPVQGAGPFFMTVKIRSLFNGVCYINISDFAGVPAIIPGFFQTLTPIPSQFRPQTDIHKLIKIFRDLTNEIGSIIIKQNGIIELYKDTDQLWNGLLTQGWFKIDTSYVI